MGIQQRGEKICLDAGCDHVALTTQFYAQDRGLDEPRVRGKVFARDEHRVGGWLESHTRPVLEERVPDCCLDDLGLVAAGDLDLPDHEAREGLVRGCLRAAADDDCRRDDGRNQNNETLEHGIPFWSP
ncbi:MAG: hypothetical protein UW07_C0025G0007 [Candidatus Nomurabacteria bacterium GW2011_GWF2_43_8]|uniref:Uncharacterized protein n=2 Tax=Candidatus Nomuraibacteriota TaxID=1752729 RepID=A0A0G1FMP1_9BACT|nr:MAG: hypothetical protein UV76_C0004G0040 [Candidatus Nomurabacteria bacterium GW2011_GWA2_43_15]KKT23248.1 MAG: hypothetical protein UW07_C0025G0007 [Candidatus Nomurabacteria bacterium GW2011_GWF2_43_8]